MGNSQNQNHWFKHLKGIKILLTLLFFLFSFSRSMACTVFVLTDGKKTYFFNNEDFTNTKTRIWFVPKGKGHFGCAYVGFDDGEGQGGLNTKGLAFDWVTVDGDSYTVDPNYVPDKKLIKLNKNTSQWMLERCKTVKEAINFYQTYSEPAFARTTLFIADKSGNSVVIGSKNGKLYFDTTSKSRGSGYGETTFQKLHKTENVPTISEGSEILRQCAVAGSGGTKYSNSYNLHTGEIEFYNFANPRENTKFSLSDELKKGAHYYETSKITAQINQSVVPLTLNMNRHILTMYQPLKNQEHKITAKIQYLFSEVTSGKLKYDDLSDSFTNDLKKSEENIKAIYGRFGNLKSLELIYKAKVQNSTDYSYIMKFENVSILWQFLFNDQHKIYDFNTLSIVWK
ncbi:hypothetical protein [Chryseobacterium sp. NFX27]|uniref:hypothetical protein n=1 Tax=Chryseobacterium sp. NFX27 TaxID=2819618 RepID=UPI003CF716E4